jgi:hypothetical protein
MRISHLLLAVPVAVSFPSFAHAHRPFSSDGFFGTRQTAFPIRDPQESIVLNHVVTCDHGAVWLHFQVNAGDTVHLQVGVPQIARLDAFRPAVALVGPGLDDAIPIGPGVLHGRRLDPLPARTMFHDKESDTTSWVYFEQDVTVPAAGTYDVAAWSEDFSTGKLWVAVGTKETFTAADGPLFPIWIEELGLFYEKSAPGAVVAPCPQPDASLTHADLPSTPPAQSGGCRQSARGPEGHEVLFGVAALAWMAGRRRRSDAPGLEAPVRAVVGGTE